MAVENVDERRRARLIELLDIDLRWRMHKVSDGQRRRVQICMGLLHPFQVWSYAYLSESSNRMVGEIGMYCQVEND